MLASQGFDFEGDFEVQKRYSDFFAFRKALQTRWPGVFIPSMPPKKVYGNMNNAFLEDRKKGLEKFLKGVARYEFFVTSKEFNLFIRHKGDLFTYFQTLIKERPEEIMNKYQKAFNL